MGDILFIQIKWQVWKRSGEMFNIQSMIKSNISNISGNEPSISQELEWHYTTIVQHLWAQWGGVIRHASLQMVDTLIINFMNRNLTPITLNAAIRNILNTFPGLGLWVWVYGVYRHFQQYFSYIVAVSFIGGGNRSTRRKPPTCCKSLTNFIT